MASEQHTAWAATALTHIRDLCTGPAYHLRLDTGHDDRFTAELREAAAAAPLDEALAGIKRIADAAGLFKATCQDTSISEVCDRLAAWCADARPAGWPAPVTEVAKRMSTGWLVRDTSDDIERIYPVDKWATDQRAEGTPVASRRVIVVEDWAEDLPPGQVLVGVIHVAQWKDPRMSEQVPAREGWQVRCSAHGLLEDGWAYNAAGNAKALATRHRRKHQQGDADD